MTSVYIGLGLAALFFIGLIVFVAVRWSGWTSKQRKYGIAGLVGLVFMVGSIVWFSYSFSMTYATPSELLSGIRKGEIKLGEQVKIEGKIVEGSINTYNLGNTTEFELKDKKTKVKVLYNGALPDNFKPGIQAVAVGSYDGKVFKTDDVKTKCPSKYKAAPKDAKEIKTIKKSTK